MQPEELSIKLYKILQKFVRNNYFIDKKLCLNREDLINEIYRIFITRGYLDRYDRTKCPFRQYVCVYANYIVSNLVKRASTLRRKGVDISISYYDKDNEETDTEEFYDERTPEDFVIKKQIIDRARNFFTRAEIEILSGERTYDSQGKIEGISKQRVHQKLQNKMKEFRKEIGNEN